MADTTAAPNGFQAKKILLTYSQVDPLDVDKQELYDWAVATFNPNFIKVAQERHADNGIHFHMILRWSEKRHYRSMSTFDYKNYHPNWKVIKGGKADWQRVVLYLDKDDKAPLCSNNLEVYSIFNFVKERANHMAHQQAMYMMTLLEIKYPVKLNLRGIPDAQDDKKRHLWLWGDSDIGKSTWFKETFKKYNYYQIPENGDAKLDGYENQGLIWFDDIDMTQISWSVLVALCDEARPWTVQYPGRTRYANKYLDGKTRLVIVTSNYPPPTSLEHAMAFKARFNVYKVTKRTFTSTERERSRSPEEQPVPVRHVINVDDDDELNALVRLDATAHRSAVHHFRPIE